jgi:L-ascorbate metabolism protein UlaG (beta-lactamase superfamily)
MKLQLIRNATLRLKYGGSTILIDPMLGPRHSFSSFAGIEHNPIVDLPVPITEVMKNIDLLLISHLHQDHFDPKAQEIIDRSLPILCQPGDQETITKYGFSNVRELISDTQWEHIKITRTGGQHGTGRWAERLNPVSGFVFEHPGEPAIYWIGDSVWCEEVQQVLELHRPDVVISHSGGAELEDSGPIIMDSTQTIKVCEALPSATVIASHLEALDHCQTSRKALRRSAQETGIDSNRLLIPADGEAIEIREGI